MNSISRLSNDELNRHLRVFLKNLPLYASDMDIAYEEIELLARQHKAFSWALDVNEKLSTYTKDIKNLLGELQDPVSHKISMLYFMDLPRPPVFVVQSNIRSTFKNLVLRVKSAPGYSLYIGIELGIEKGNR